MRSRIGSLSACSTVARSSCVCTTVIELSGKVRHPSYNGGRGDGMTKDRYVAASIAQYLHELSGRHADEREHAHEREERRDEPRLMTLSGRLAGGARA